MERDMNDLSRFQPSRWDGNHAFWNPGNKLPGYFQMSLWDWAVLNVNRLQKNAHSGKRQRMGLGLFQKGNNLLPLDAGEAVEKIFNGVAGPQMVKQALHRHA